MIIIMFFFNASGRNKVTLHGRELSSKDVLQNGS